MGQQSGSSNDLFSEQVIAMFPKLRIQALALKRNKSAAEDLVQDTVCNALHARESFIARTNFPAWMHRILRNRFISDLRKHRDTTEIGGLPEAAFATEAAHDDGMALPAYVMWPALPTPGLRLGTPRTHIRICGSQPAHQSLFTDVYRPCLLPCAPISAPVAAAGGW